MNLVVSELLGVKWGVRLNHMIDLLSGTIANRKKCVSLAGQEVLPSGPQEGSQLGQLLGQERTHL